MTDNEIIVALLFLSVMITMIGGIVVLIKLLNVKDVEKEVKYAERCRQEFNNRD